MHKILYLERHPIIKFGLPNGFKKIGCDVAIKWFKIGKDLENFVSKFRPQLIFTSGVAIDYTSEIRNWLKENSSKYNYKFIHWDTDGILWNYMVWPYINESKPHFVFTICPDMLDFLKKKGINSTILDFGYNPEIHHKATPDKNYEDTIAIIGNAYLTWLKRYPDNIRTKSTLVLIKPFVYKNIPINIWGHHWNKIGSVLGWKIPNNWLKGPCEYTDTNNIYSNASINLCLQNHEHYLSKRTYEILGSEGFAITYNTPAVKDHFKHGEDLIIVSSPEEAIEAAQFYVKNPSERERIKVNGNRKIKNHTYEHRAKYVLKTLKKNNIISSLIKVLNWKK